MEGTDLDNEHQLSRMCLRWGHCTLCWGLPLLSRGSGDTWGFTVLAASTKCPHSNLHGPTGSLSGSWLWHKKPARALSIASFAALPPLQLDPCNSTCLPWSCWDGSLLQGCHSDLLMTKHVVTWKSIVLTYYCPFFLFKAYNALNRSHSTLPSY